MTGDPSTTAHSVAKYFHPSYTQTVDGIQSSYQGTIEHISSLRFNCQTLEIQVQSFTHDEAQRTMSEWHTTQLIMKDGTILVMDGYLFAKLADDGRMLHVDELTRLVSTTTTVGNTDNSTHKPNDLFLNKEDVKKAWEDLIMGDPSAAAVEKSIDKYFHPSYTQKLNLEPSNRKEMVALCQATRRSYAKLNIEVLDFVRDGNVIALHYLSHIVTFAGEKREQENCVFGELEEDGRLVRATESIRTV